jgi:hypothetical protein
MSVSLKKEEEVTPHSREKRKAMQQDGQWEKRNAEPVPIDRQPLPDAAEGWTPDKPKADGTLCVSAVKTIRMSDGSSRKFYRMSVPVAEVRDMKNRVRKLRRRIKKEDQAAAKKSAKRAARVVLLALGKQF